MCGVFRALTNMRQTEALASIIFFVFVVSFLKGESKKNY